MSAILKGNKIYLRSMRPGDMDKILAWENDPENWKVSETTAPFAPEDILQFVSAPQDIYLTGQLRLIICLNETSEAIGALDLYGFDGLNQRAGVGILIEAPHRRKGYALDALSLLPDFAFYEVGIRTLFALIHADNLASLRLFESAGYKAKADQTAGEKWPGTLLYEQSLAV